MASSKDLLRGGAAAGASSGEVVYPEIIDLTMGDPGAGRRKRKLKSSATSSVIIDIDDDQGLDHPSIIFKGNGSGKRNKNSGQSDELQLEATPAKSLFASGENHSTTDGPELNASSEIELDSQVELFLKYSDDHISYSNIGNYDIGKIEYNFLEESNNFGNSYFTSQVDTATLSPWMEPSFPWLQNMDGSTASMVPCVSKAHSSVSASRLDTGLSSLHSSQPNSSIQKNEDGTNSEIDKNFRSFKHFDTVRDYSDHHFSSGGAASVSQSRKAAKWSKTIQHEWKLLESNLPESIFVRVYEERMDLMRAVIIGAAGTPYHDGLFFFDIIFPATYPQSPPRVHYHSGGLRLNPNLYHCGKVCLSLLNTWSGSKAEMWTPGKSTMLQVLLSIQALVLNAKPYFNEPGYASSAGHPDGEKKSEDYSENTFILSCRTMLYTIKRPPKHFEGFVMGHFCQRALPILDACKAYMDGAQVGTLASGGIQDVDEGDKSCSTTFKASVGQILPLLIEAFKEKGFHCARDADLNQYPAPKTFANACLQVPLKSKPAPKLQKTWL